LTTVAGRCDENIDVGGVLWRILAGGEISKSGKWDLVANSE
jgi:hypothetical protein